MVQLPRLVPSTARTGVHLHVDLLSLTGLGAAVEAGQAGPIHARMHCLLLLPPPSLANERTAPSPPPKLLATAVSSDLPKSAFANDMDTRLDVLLPLSWMNAGAHVCLLL